MPGPPTTGVVESWDGEEFTVLANVEAAAEAPPERVAPMRYTTMSAMAVRMARARRRAVMVTVIWL
jgi:hypothetical protein